VRAYYYTAFFKDKNNKRPATNKRGGDLKRIEMQDFNTRQAELMKIDKLIPPALDPDSFLPYNRDEKRAHLRSYPVEMKF
jgi:hypothetical protein